MTCKHCGGQYLPAAAETRGVPGGFCSLACFGAAELAAAEAELPDDDDDGEED